MIIFGTRASRLNTVQVKDAVCPECDAKDSLVMSVFGRYFHIFWIPFFPYTKVGVSQCLHCKAAKEGSEMPADQKSAFKAIKKVTKHKKIHFLGLVAFSAFACFSVYSAKQSNKLTDEYLASPQVGDVYKVKYAEDTYSTMKVANVFGDTLELYPNNYTVNKSKILYKINKSDNYSENRIRFAKSKLNEMRKEQEILSIDRKQ